MKKNVVYYPLTATPFKKNISYTEIEPCKELCSYVRCFWGMQQPVVQAAQAYTAEIVIPDTCADIIYYIDYTDNTVSGGFCGVNDHSFYTCGEGKTGHLMSMFAIRFYAWSAYAFTEDTLKSTVNGYYEVGSRFGWLDRLIRPRLMEMESLQEKVSYAEQFLMKRVQNAKENKIVNGTVKNILLNNGSLEVSNLAKESFVSVRQLERLFHEYVGITPKKLSNLIRYQLLWREILCNPDFDILNAVHKYGYADQSHLLHEFKRYHSMDIHSAKTIALKDVENIQDTLDRL